MVAWVVHLYTIKVAVGPVRQLGQWSGDKDQEQEIAFYVCDQHLVSLKADPSCDAPSEPTPLFALLFGTGRREWDEKCFNKYHFRGEK